MTGSRIGVVLAALALHGAALAGEVRVGVELNKLEQADGACRAFLVVENPAPTDLETLTLDLVVFDGEGVIAERLAVELAPVRAEGMSVKAFDMAGLDCARIGRILMIGVLACDADGAEAPCAGPPAVSARGDVPLID
jgi:hypothetical protein